MDITISTPVPKDITKDRDTGEEFASFGYYEGSRYAKENNLGFSTSFSQVREGKHYIVCCGAVMVACNPTMWPDIKRREI